MINLQRRVPLLTVLVCSNALLYGCGGDDGGSASASSSPPPVGAGPPESSLPPPTSSSPPSVRALPPPASANRAPVIAGSPPASITQGSAYSFAPEVSDADDNPLSFSVANLPRWATFDSRTGLVTGTPSVGDVGTYADITITVSDGWASTTLAAFDIDVVGTASGSATLLWNPPTQNTDGSPLTNLAGYRVYWGTSRNKYSNSVTIENPGLSSYVVDQLTPATWYFALTAINSLGAESGYSNIAAKTVF